VDPLIAAVQTLLDQTGRAGLDSVINYSSSSFFDDRVLTPPSRIPGSIQRRIILWAGTPEDPRVRPVETRPYVSPSELALIWAGQTWIADRTAPFFQVIALDLPVDAVRRSPLYEILALRRGSNRQADWLQCYSIDELEEFGRVLIQPVDSISPTPSPDLTRGVTLAYLGRGMLASNPDASHHDIANLIGPQMLLRAMGSPDLHESGHRKAIRQLVSSGDSHSDNANPLSPPWIAASSIHLWQQLSLTPVLLDDMGSFGWTDFLAAALGQAGEGLTLLTTPEDLDRALAQEDFFDRKVLFCDLRLFAGRPDEEREFLTELVQVASQHRADAVAGRLGPELPTLPDEKTLLRDADERLALLPRILAHRFPHLPIIVFSSTQRIGVARILRDYPTIIMEFVKPSLRSAREIDGFAWRRAFDRSVTRALAVASVRDQVVQLTSEARVRDDDVGTAGRHVEIYLDESGLFDNDAGVQSRVGGLVVEYPDVSTAETFAAAMEEHKFLFGYHRDQPAQFAYPPPVIADCLYKFAPPDQKQIKLQQLEQLAVETGIRITRVIVTLETGAAKDRVGVDGRYFEALVGLLALLIVSRPSLSESSVSVYLATRQLHLRPSEAYSLARRFATPAWLERPSEPKNSGLVREVHDRKGLERFDGAVEKSIISASYRGWGKGGPSGEAEVLAESDLQGDPPAGTLGPIQEVEGVLTSFESSAAVHVMNQARMATTERYEWQIESCVGVTFYPYVERRLGKLAFTQPPKWSRSPRHCRPRLIHYIVDWVLREHDDELVPELWRTRGFVESLGGAKLILQMDAHAARREFAEALEARSRLGEHGSRSDSSAAQPVLKRLARALHRTTRAEWTALLAAVEKRVRPEWI